MFKKYRLILPLLSILNLETAYCSPDDEDRCLSRFQKRVIGGSVLMLTGGGLAVMSFFEELKTNRPNPMISGYLEIDNSWTPVIIGGTIFSFGIFMFRSAFSDNP